MKKFISSKQETPQMFKRPWMEILSKVPWFLPHLLFIPVVGVLLVQAYSLVSLGAFLAIFIGGIFFWTLAEYFFHRIIFHYECTSQFGQRLHWIAHGVHHDYPNDPKRLVLPPVLSVPLATFFYFVYTYLLGTGNGSAFMAGFLTGYMAYEFIHYAVHHLTAKKGLLAKMRKWHMKHHFKDEEAGFGVSSPLWDYIFKTHQFKSK